MIYKGRVLDFAFRKLELDTIYNAYSNESPFKYYISVLACFLLSVSVSQSQSLSLGARNLLLKFGKNRVSNS